MKLTLHTVWHATCLNAQAMKRSFISLPARTRGELVLSIILALAITAAALIPSSGRSAAAGGSISGLFQVMESDYLQPKYASAREVQALNSSARAAFTFAGYDEFTCAMRLASGMQNVNVTRYAGPVFSLLQLEYILRDRANLSTPRVLLSEKFWENEFQRDASVVGQPITINCSKFIVAGIVKCSGPLCASTDIWMPICSRGPLGEAAFLRIIGRPGANADWNTVAKGFSARTANPWRDLLSELMRKPVLLPVERGLLLGGPETDRELLANSSADVPKLRT